jgi:eukaryotic-like serine/threonine-protein kinase
LSKSSDPLIQKIGKYVVVDVIGSGGMGIVYRAHDIALNRTVAIKMLKRVGAADNKSAMLEQFFARELRATASLQHRNIVTVYESGEQDGNPYLVMECLDGEPVSRIINERRAMPIVDKLELLVQVCDGLQHAHDRKPQVIHRDIKPANVILSRDGTAKIVDFGIARVVGVETSTLQTGQLLGSLPYLSPEQINSMPIDSRTDIFSAGVMLYELLTYTLPFKGDEPAAVFVKILREDPAPLSKYLTDVPPELQACVDRALAKKTHDRYQAAEELGFDLLQIQKKIKQGMAADFMQKAESAMQRGDLERVRLHLQEILRLDRHHEQANRLLAEVRKAIQEQQRSAQIVQMRSQAQVALAGQQYEEALGCAEQALQLDPSDQVSTALREEIQKAITLSKAVRDSLRRAESALYAGDFDEGREAVSAALRLDNNSAEARALAEIIEKEFSERSRRLQVQGLVDSARQGIAQRHFGDAIDSLRKAEQLDPADSNVRELLQWASRGHDQEQRRKDLLDLTDQIHGALRAEDFSSAYTICEVGLGNFPNEPTLQRLKSIAEKQRDIAERRRFVQDQSLSAKESLDRTDFTAAIRILETALQKLPAEPNLEALLALARTESEQQSVDRQSQAAQEAAERALLQNQAAQRLAETLRAALQERAELAHLEDLASQLRSMLMGVEFDEATRRSFDPIFERVRARQLAKEQVSAELQDLRKSVEESFDPGSRARAKARLQEAQAEFPHEGKVREACEEVMRVLDARGEEHERILAELSEIAQAVKHVPLSQSTGLLSRASRLSSNFSMEPQVGALFQQIEYEVNRRLAQRQALIEELAQLERACPHARSISGLSQLVSNAHSVASTAAGEPGVLAGLDQVKAVAEARRHTISRLLVEINQIADRALMAVGVEQAEQLFAEAQQRAAAHPELDDLQETIGRVSAQVHGRRIEYDLVCEELSSLSGSVSHALTPADLDVIRGRALQIRDKHTADQAIAALCTQVESDVRGARAKLLQIELRRLSQDQAVEPSTLQLGTTDSASLVKKLQDLAKTYPESVELRGMLLRAEDSLERAQRARNEAAARASAIDLEVKAYTRMLESRQAAKALRALEEAAAKYPESEQLQSLLVQCKEQIEAEEEIERQASAQRAALQSAVDYGQNLLRNRRYVEAAALLEVACQQWPGEKRLEKLLAGARKSAQKLNEQQAAEQAKIRQSQIQVAPSPAGTARKRLLVGVVLGCVLLAIVGFLTIFGIRPPFATRPRTSVLTVQSIPAGAEIEVDGQTCVTPNCSLQLSPGAIYSVKAGLKGYVSTSQSVALTGDQTIYFALDQETARETPPTPAVPPPAAPTQTPVTARLILKGLHSGDRLFVDDIALAGGYPPGTWELPPGSHRLRLMAGKQELVADPRSFKANATVVLNRADFKQPALATSEEQLAWNRINSTSDPSALEEFVRRYPDSSFRSQAASKLEALNWAKASSGGTLHGYQDYVARYTSPPGPHLSAAMAEIARLEWDAIQTTTDPVSVRRFLERNPSGPYRDRAAALLDDLTWRDAQRKGDSASLKGYLGANPSGRHKDEATAQLTKFAPPPIAAPAPQAPAAAQTPAPIPPPPPVTPKPTDNSGDVNAIRAVLDGYKSAYDTKDLARLQELWPDMSPRQVNGLRTAFRDAGKVTLTYAITKGPEISGDVAVVTFQQQIVTNAAARAQVTMTLKKDAANSWHITSVR